MRIAIAIGALLFGVLGCSVGDGREDDRASTAFAPQAISSDPFVNGRDLVAEDPELRLEIAGVDTASVRLRSLRLHRIGDSTVVGELEADGLNDALFRSSAEDHRVTEVTVTRGKGATLTIGDVVFTPVANALNKARLRGEGCPNNCSGLGVCIEQVCRCIPGYSGIDCSQSSKECPGTPACSGNGVCVLGECKCLPGYLPPDCVRVDAP